MPRLTGRKVLLTRSAEDSADWARALAAEGARPIVLPCIATEPCGDPDLGQRIAAALDGADWVVVTSRRGVDALADLTGSKLPAPTRLAAVGETTARRLCERFGRAPDRTGSGTARALAGMLAAAASHGERYVLVLAENAGDVLERTLGQAGAEVTRFDVYRTVPAGSGSPKRGLSTLGADTIVFASPSAVTGFGNQIDVDIEPQIVTIGPSTSAAVRAHDWAVAAEAKTPQLSGVIDAILEATHVRTQA
ncbi:MAG TPA: uroporphyrinogen-III synthase [Gammaproteobacteria bacterium]|nr:uroporphyrinogen-III synthase [Gammaproteobacteria bacterium]